MLHNTKLFYIKVTSIGSQTWNVTYILISHKMLLFEKPICCENGQSIGVSMPPSHSERSLKSSHSYAKKTGFHWELTTCWFHGGNIENDHLYCAWYNGCKSLAKSQAVGFAHNIHTFTHFQGSTQGRGGLIKSQCFGKHWTAKDFVFPSIMFWNIHNPATDHSQLDDSTFPVGPLSDSG